MALLCKVIPCLWIALSMPFLVNAEGEGQPEVLQASDDANGLVSQTSELEMEDARIRFLIWIGEPEQGLKRLGTALSADPENVDLQIVQADMDYHLGRSVAAYEEITRLNRRAADSPEVKQLNHLIQALHQPRITATWAYDHPASHTQTTFFQIKAERSLGYLQQRIGIRLDHVNLKSDSLSSADTGASEKYTVNQNDGAVYYRYLDESGDEAGLEFQTRQKHFSVLGDFKKWTPSGFHRFSVMTNRSTWQMVEAIANEYRRDGLLYESDYYLGYSLQSHWGLGLYRYHTKNRGNVAKGTWYYLGLDYKIPLRFTERWLRQYPVIAHYDIKGEHYTEYSHVEAAEDLPYQPFSVQNREVHRMIAEFPLKNEASYYQINPFVGFGLNTHESGALGIICGLDARYYYADHYDFSLHLGRDFIQDNPHIGYTASLGTTIRIP